MKSIAVLICLFAVSSAKVIGVSPQSQHLYEPNSIGKWTCLSNPEIELSIDQINDDFCDCPDGSDEPGTSACTSQSNKFFCENEGHVSNSLDNFKVNDGVCDYDLCCDGSDEWKFPGKCPNKCDIIHQQYVNYQKSHNAKITKGLKSKSKLVSKAVTIRNELVEKLGVYLNELSLQNSKYDDLIELVETSDDFVEDDTNILLNNILPEINNIEEFIEKQQTILYKQNDQINKLEDILSNLIKNYNPNFNDLAVKDSVLSYQDYISNKEDDQIINQEISFENIINEVKGIELTGQQQSQPVAIKCDFQKAFNEGYKSLIDSFLGINQVQPSRKPSAAKQEELNSLTSHIDNIKNEIKILKDDLDSSNYGSDDILRSLTDKCITNRIGEYDYKYCFTSTIHQIGNGNNALIGNFESLTNDEEGLKLYYENGAKCWNGPNRRGIVTVICGEEDEVVSESEPEKCEYHFIVKSSIGCFENNFDNFEFEIDYDLLS